MSDFRKIVSAAVGCSPTASDDEIATALAEMLRPGSSTATAQGQGPGITTTRKTFTEMVSAVMATENISYGEAASKVSRERPDLYALHCQAADINRAGLN
jgi:hypothetical protein